MAAGHAVPRRLVQEAVVKQQRAGARGHVRRCDIDLAAVQDVEHTVILARRGDEFLAGTQGEKLSKRRRQLALNREDVDLVLLAQQTDIVLNQAALAAGDRAADGGDGKTPNRLGRGSRNRLGTRRRFELRLERSKHGLRRPVPGESRGL
ncbi:hypothetical protein D3C73_418520 [compost metagenome]